MSSKHSSMNLQSGWNWSIYWVETKVASFLLSNHILTPLIPNPNLMNFSRRNINPLSNMKRLLFNLPVIQFSIIIRVSDCQRSTADKVCCQTAMRVRGIMGVTDGQGQHRYIRSPMKDRFAAGDSKSGTPNFGWIISTKKKHPCTYLPSVQVKICRNPHSRTRRSLSARVPVGYFSIMTAWIMISSVSFLRMQWNILMEVEGWRKRTR